MIPTYGIQYLGSKRKIVDKIVEVANSVGTKTAIDVFTGTTRVAQALRQSGISTITSDLSAASKIYASTFNQQKDSSHLQPHIDLMNTMEGYRGWVTDNYSGGENWLEPRGYGRYIQPHNAMIVDQARDYIEALRNNTQISSIDADTLVCSIIFAINEIHNSLGHQQAYLKEWTPATYKKIHFKLPPVLEGPIAEHIVGDCFKIDYPQADLAYLDPPYTAVEYHTFYHIWDSIAIWDKPQTELIAKRRIDRVKKGKKNSETYDKTFIDIPWYSKTESAKAFEVMLERLSHIPNILVSYSNESNVSKQDLLTIFEKHGEVEIHEIAHSRTSLGTIAKSTAGNKVVTEHYKVTEYLFLIKRK